MENFNMLRIVNPGFGVTLSYGGLLRCNLLPWKSWLLSHCSQETAHEWHWDQASDVEFSELLSVPWHQEAAVGPSVWGFQDDGTSWTLGQDDDSLKEWRGRSWKVQDDIFRRYLPSHWSDISLHWPWMLIEFVLGMKQSRGKQYLSAIQFPFFQNMLHEDVIDFLICYAYEKLICILFVWGTHLAAIIGYS